MYTRVMAKQTYITKATTDARKHFKALMPDADCLIETRGTADPATLAPQTRTVVTIPVGHRNTEALRAALAALPGAVKAETGHGRITVTRER